MNEEKMRDLQLQVRQNQQELMDYVKDLDGWRDEMRLREQQLKQDDRNCSEVSSVFICPLR